MSSSKKDMTLRLKMRGFGHGNVGHNTSCTPCAKCDRVFRQFEDIAINYKTENLWDYFCLPCIGISEKLGEHHGQEKTRRRKQAA